MSFPDLLTFFFGFFVSSLSICCAFKALLNSIIRSRFDFQTVRVLEQLARFEGQPGSGFHALESTNIISKLCSGIIELCYVFDYLFCQVIRFIRRFGRHSENWNFLPY